MNYRTFVLGLTLCSAFATAIADDLPPGLHGVPRKVCYEFADSAGYQPVAVIYQVSGGEPYPFVLLQNDSCVDQGYKFNRVKLYWVPKSVLGGGWPGGVLDLSIFLRDSTPILPLTNDGNVASNYTQAPDSIPQVSERWVYTIVGGYTAETTVEKCFGATATSPTSCTLLNIDYLWPNSMVLPARTRTASPSLELVQVQGSKIRVRIPGQTATLRVFTLSGRLLRQMRIASTHGALGEVDLGMTPPRGSFVELKQGDVRSVIAVGSR